MLIFGFSDVGLQDYYLKKNAHRVNLGRRSADRGPGFGGGQVGSAKNWGRGSVSGNFITNSFLVRGTPSVSIIVRLESNF